MHFRLMLVTPSLHGCNLCIVCSTKVTAEMIPYRLAMGVIFFGEEGEGEIQDFVDL